MRRALVSIGLLTGLCLMSLALPARARVIDGGSIGPLARVSAAANVAVPSAIDLVYIKRQRALAGFVTVDLVEALHAVDAEGCVYDRTVKLFRSRKVGTHWRDEVVSKTTTDEDGFYGFQWKKGTRVPSSWWLVKVTRTAFSGQYGDLITCSAAASTRVKT